MIVLFTHFGSSNVLHAIRYDGVGGWGAAVTPASNMVSFGYWSATIQSDTVHVAFLKVTSYDIIYTTYNYGTNVFSAETTLYSAATSTSIPTISRTTDDNNLHAFWENDPTDDHMYYNRYNASTGNWTGYYDLITEIDLLPSLGYHLNSDLTVDSDNLGVYYVAGTVILKFKLLSSPFEVTTLYADGISNVYATLNGSIDSLSFGSATTRGFIYKAGSDPLGGNATDLHEDGTFNVGAFYLTTLPYLTPSTLYHFRAYAMNVFGTEYGEDEQFSTGAVPTPTPSGTPTPTPTMPPGNSCTIAPDVSTTAATYVSMTSARLNARLISDGGGETYIRFQYYTGAGTWTDNETDWTGGYWSGNPFAYKNITGLLGNATYHFRAQAVNPCGNDTGADLTFTTAQAIGNVTEFLAIPRVDSLAIDLKWAKPSGTTSVMVRYKLGSYPGNSTDGILVCNETDNAYSHTGLTAGATLWYAAWGVSGNNTSAAPAYAKATVSLVAPGGGTNVPGMPTNWFRDVMYTNLDEAPGYGIIIWVADSFGFSREFTFMAIGLTLCILAFIAAYVVSKGNLVTAGLAALVIMSVEVPMGIMAGFLPFLWAFVTGTYIVLKART